MAGRKVRGEKDRTNQQTFSCRAGLEQGKEGGQGKKCVGKREKHAVLRSSQSGTGAEEAHADSSAARHRRPTMTHDAENQQEKSSRRRKRDVAREKVVDRERNGAGGGEADPAPHADEKNRAQLEGVRQRPASPARRQERGAVRGKD
jgi:hypothetical protein